MNDYTPKERDELKKHFGVRGDQFCFSCGRLVEFPHQCPNIFGKANTHAFKPCVKTHGWHKDGEWVRCENCTWHIEVPALKDIAACPATKTVDIDLAKSAYTGLVNGVMACPTCKTAMKKLFSSKDGKESRYYCPKCAPLLGT